MRTGIKGFTEMVGTISPSCTIGVDSSKMSAGMVSFGTGPEKKKTNKNSYTF